MNETGERSPMMPGSGSEASLTELRRVLVGVEQRQLAHLTERLDDPVIRAQELAHVLPDAVRVRSARDSTLTEALQPSISSALEHAVTHDPAPFANALFPVLGPAIRAAVADMLSRALASLDSALTNTFSVQGFKWRFEAWRTGRSFAEVVMLRTLVYRVEQLVLIDRMTGLPLQHLLADDVRTKDAADRSSMMSGMLTAIRDFVHDAFGAKSSSTLDSFAVGDLRVWIEQGPRVLLAGVIRGVPPEDLRLTMREIVEALHLQFGAAFARFEGDTAPFELARPTLQRAFASRYSTGGSSRSMAKAWTVVALVALALIGVAGWWWYRGYRFGEYVDRLRAEPGYVVTDASRRGLGFAVAGLRDPDATPASELRRGIAYDSLRTAERWAPYLSLDTSLTLRRAVRRVRPPAHAVLTLSGDTIRARGAATSAWRESARILAVGTPGVRVWTDGALELDVRTRSDSLARLVNGTRITFATGSSLLRDADRAQTTEIGGWLRTLLALAPKDGGIVQVAVAGFTDPTGTDSLNMRLARERADVVRAALTTAGIPIAALRDATPASVAAARAALANRVTSVQVTLQWDAAASRP